MSTWAERKAERSGHYRKYVVGWKTRKCSACSGTGRYDSTGSPKCSGCGGTGKEKYRDSVDKQ